MIPNQSQIKKKFIEELESNPIVQVACTKLSIPRSTYYRWTKTDKQFSNKCSVARKISTPIINDLATSAIINKITDGDFKSSKFWLENNHPMYRRNSMQGSRIRELEREAERERNRKEDERSDMAIEKLDELLRRARESKTNYSVNEKTNMEDISN